MNVTSLVTETAPQGVPRSQSAEGLMMRKPLLLCLTMTLLCGCASLRYPDTVTPVQGFELDRYLGTWYEIARLDHSFERGLERVSAEYSVREGGGILVKNRGYLKSKNTWKEAVGKAFFVRASDEGYLKVSFFGPFYGSYVIFELDKEGYQYAFVSGPDESYLWLLSRQPTISDDLLNRFRDQAQSLGFNIDDLIYVNHE